MLVTTVTKYEEQQIQVAYNTGLISKEECNKLLNDITKYLWDELTKHLWDELYW